MNYITFIQSAAIPAFLLAYLFVTVIRPWLQTERQARALLAQHPNAEQTSVYLELHSMFASSKQREIDAKIAEMQPQGWTFLRAVGASQFRTIFALGGGLTLHFIRTKV